MSLAPFISRQDLSDRLGRDVTADDNARIAVDSACWIVRTLTEQQVNYQTDETITLDGEGTDKLILPEVPVTDVTSVLEGDEAVTDYQLFDDGTLVREGGLPWAVGRYNIEVTYSHGWTEVPSDLRVVALNLAERLFTRGGGSAVFESLGSYQVRYDGEADTMTKTEDRVLRKYKRTKQPWATLVAS